MESIKPSVKWTNFWSILGNFFMKLLKMGSENFQTGIDLIFRISKNGIDWTRCEMNKFLKHFVPFLMKMVEMGSENFQTGID